MEAERLCFLRYNQSKRRATNHTWLLELLVDSAIETNEVTTWTEGIPNKNTGQIGRLVVLPATYIGGDRYMCMKMHHIICISNNLGHSDVFLTMTCNPNWPEILDAIFDGQKPQDRSDICNGVFKMKQKMLLQYLKSENPFRRMIANVSVIEFQKRGLPQAHVILFLDQKAKHNLQNSEYVEKLISSEIPTNSDSSLRSLVLKHMIQNPVHNWLRLHVLVMGNAAEDSRNIFEMRLGCLKVLIISLTDAKALGMAEKLYVSPLWYTDRSIRIVMLIILGFFNIILSYSECFSVTLTLSSVY